MINKKIAAVKKLNKKTILGYAAVLILFLLASFVMYSLRSEQEYADYTSYSTNSEGAKALYLLTGRMGFKTDRFQKEARFLPQVTGSSGTVLVTVYPEEDLINDKLETKYLRNWLEAGNILIIASDRDTFINYDIGTGVKHEAFSGIRDDNLIAGKVGKGWLLLFDGGEELVNGHIKGTSYAVSFLKILSQTGSKQIYFDEYYHNINDSSILALEIIGPTGRLILLQLLIALAILIIILAKRFGKPVEVFEIIKRQENENLIAISNLYMRSKDERMVLEMYLKSFRSELASYLGLGGQEGQTDDVRLATAAASDKLLKNRNIKGLFEECGRFTDIDRSTNNAGRTKGRRDIRKMVHLVEKIEEIRKELK